MPVHRETISLAVFADEMGIDPRRLLGVEFNRRSTSVVLILEPEDMQTSNTFPQLNKGGKKIGGKTAGGGKRGC